MANGFTDQLERGGDGIPGVYINPGTEPVEGTSEDRATRNMAQLAKDIGCNMLPMRLPEEDYGEGRYAFSLDGHEVQMPGLPLDQVRYMKEGGQNIWDFPRLYVDGSSWVWKYALGVLTDDS